MKLKSLDTMHVSAVKSDSLRPGEQFQISDEAGAALMKRHPTKFEVVDEKSAAEKAEPAPSNKAEGAAPANKAANQRKKKGAK